MAEGIVDEATSAILAADLTPIEHRILVNFVKEAIEPNLAAQEILNNIAHGEGRPVEDTLRGIKENWHKLVSTISCPTPVDGPIRNLVFRRDKSRCCVTPPDRRVVDLPEPTFLIPPSMAKLCDDDATESPSKSLLDAFLTPTGSTRLQTMLTDRSDQGRLANTWLLTPSLRRALQNGHLQIRPTVGTNWEELEENAKLDGTNATYHILPIYPEEYENIALADRSSFHNHGLHCRLKLKTDDPKQLPLLDPFLIKIHCKFANALHQFYVEERIAEGWGPLHSRSFFSRNFQFFARSIWLLLPRFVRTAFYRHILKKGKSYYGHNISEVVQQLPFGLYAKMSDRTGGNESNTLILLEKEAPSIPAPIFIDTFRDADVNWFIMTGLPGVHLHEVLHRMSYPERSQLVKDITQALDQMHKIQNKTPYLFANVSGGPLYDRRIGSFGNGPYNSEADLNVRLACGIQEYMKKQLPTAFSRSHKSVFTHGDLFTSNILIDGGKLSGIIDWEDSAFMPEYWDFTKAMRAARSDDVKDIYRRIWGNKFDIELETELWLKRAFPVGG